MMRSSLSKRWILLPLVVSGSRQPSDLNHETIPQEAEMDVKSPNPRYGVGQTDDEELASDNAMEQDDDEELGDYAMEDNEELGDYAEKSDYGTKKGAFGFNMGSLGDFGTGNLFGMNHGMDNFGTPFESEKEPEATLPKVSDDTPQLPDNYGLKNKNHTPINREGLLDSLNNPTMGESMMNNVKVPQDKDYAKYAYQSQGDRPAFDMGMLNKFNPLSQDSESDIENYNINGPSQMRTGFTNTSHILHETPETITNDKKKAEEEKELRSALSLFDHKIPDEKYFIPYSDRQGTMGEYAPVGHIAKEPNPLNIPFVDTLYDTKSTCEDFKCSNGPSFRKQNSAAIICGTRAVQCHEELCCLKKVTCAQFQCPIKYVVHTKGSEKPIKIPRRVQQKNNDSSCAAGFINNSGVKQQQYGWEHFGIDQTEVDPSKEELFAHMGQGNIIEEITAGNYEGYDGATERKKYSLIQLNQPNEGNAEGDIEDAFNEKNNTDNTNTYNERIKNIEDPMEENTDNMYDEATDNMYDEAMKNVDVPLGENTDNMYDEAMKNVDVPLGENTDNMYNEAMENVDVPSSYVDQIIQVGGGREYQVVQALSCSSDLCCAYENTCATFECPPLTKHLPDSTCGWGDDECTIDHCCEKLESCASIKCKEYGTRHREPDVLCHLFPNGCNYKTCCMLPETCGTFVCNQYEGWIPRKEPWVAALRPITNKSQTCCQQEYRCQGPNFTYHCKRYNHYLKEDAKSIVCGLDGRHCNDNLCCDKGLTCADFKCPRQQSMTNGRFRQARQKNIEFACGRPHTKLRPANSFPVYDDDADIAYVPSLIPDPAVVHPKPFILLQKDPNSDDETDKNDDMNNKDNTEGGSGNEKNDNYNMEDENNVEDVTKPIDKIQELKEDGIEKNYMDFDHVYMNQHHSSCSVPVCCEYENICDDHYCGSAWEPKVRYIPTPEVVAAHERRQKELIKGENYKAGADSPENKEYIDSLLPDLRSDDYWIWDESGDEIDDTDDSSNSTQNSSMILLQKEKKKKRHHPVRRSLELYHKKGIHLLQEVTDDYHVHDHKGKLAAISCGWGLNQKCDDETCCNPIPSCSTIMCPELYRNRMGYLCTTEDCTVEECCEKILTCGSFRCNDPKHKSQVQPMYGESIAERVAREQATWIQKPNFATTTCGYGSNTECTLVQCCRKNKQCIDFECPPQMQKINLEQDCGYNDDGESDCTEKKCCKEAVTCRDWAAAQIMDSKNKSFELACPTGHRLKDKPYDLFCGYNLSECNSHRCCQGPLTCEEFICPPTKRALPKTTICGFTKCTEYDCCQTPDVCLEYSCPESYRHRGDEIICGYAPVEAKYGGELKKKTTCKSTHCCDAPLTCAVKDCPATWCKVEDCETIIIGFEYNDWTKEKCCEEPIRCMDKQCPADLRNIAPHRILGFSINDWSESKCCEKPVRCSSYICPNFYRKYNENHICGYVPVVPMMITQEVYEADNTETKKINLQQHQRVMLQQNTRFDYAFPVLQVPENIETPKANSVGDSLKVEKEELVDKKVLDDLQHILGVNQDNIADFKYIPEDIREQIREEQEKERAKNAPLSPREKIMTYSPPVLCGVEICCEPPVHCSSFRCPEHSRHKDFAESLQCGHHIQDCTADFCCDAPVRCDSFECPGDYQDKTGNPVCGFDVACTTEVCCNEPLRCETVQCPSYQKVEDKQKICGYKPDDLCTIESCCTCPCCKAAEIPTYEGTVVRETLEDYTNPNESSCVCPNGVGRSPCNFEETQCIQCNDGFILENDTCVPLHCKCAHGRAAHGSACFGDSEICEICEDGYSLHFEELRPAEWMTMKEYQENNDEYGKPNGPDMQNTEVDGDEIEESAVAAEEAEEEAPKDTETEDEAESEVLENAETEDEAEGEVLIDTEAEDEAEDEIPESQSEPAQSLLRQDDKKFQILLQLEEEQDNEDNKSYDDTEDDPSENHDDNTQEKEKTAEELYNEDWTDHDFNKQVEEAENFEFEKFEIPKVENLVKNKKLTDEQIAHLKRDLYDFDFETNDSDQDPFSSEEKTYGSAKQPRDNSVWNQVNDSMTGRLQGEVSNMTDDAHDMAEKQKDAVTSEEAQIGQIIDHTVNDTQKQVQDQLAGFGKDSWAESKSDWEKARDQQAELLKGQEELFASAENFSGMIGEYEKSLYDAITPGEKTLAPLPSLEQRYIPPIVAVQCRPHTCTCSHGIPATGPRCKNGGEACDDCDTGYQLIAGLRVCTPETCTCLYGQPGFPCNFKQPCSSCNIGYRLEGGFCIKNKCTCKYGTAASAEQCLEDGEEQCTSCIWNYSLTPKNTCTPTCGLFRADHQCGPEFQYQPVSTQCITGKCTHQECCHLVCDGTTRLQESYDIAVPENADPLCATLCLESRQKRVAYFPSCKFWCECFAEDGKVRAAIPGKVYDRFQNDLVDDFGQCKEKSAEPQFFTHIPRVKQSPRHLNRNYQFGILDSGLEFLLISDFEAVEITFAAGYAVGGWDDPENFNGLGHYIEHLNAESSQHFKGSLDEYILTNGGEYTSQTHVDHTTYIGSLPYVKELEDARESPSPIYELLDRFGEGLLGPLNLSSDQLQVIDIMQQEFNELLKRPLFPLVHLLNKVRYPRGYKSNWIGGNKKTIYGESNTKTEKSEAEIKKAIIHHRDSYLCAQKLSLVMYAPYSIDNMWRKIAGSKFNSAHSTMCEEVNKRRDISNTENVTNKLIIFQGTGTEIPENQPAILSFHFRLPITTEVERRRNPFKLLEQLFTQDTSAIDGTKNLEAILRDRQLIESLSVTITPNIEYADIYFTANLLPLATEFEWKQITQMRKQITQILFSYLHIIKSDDTKLMNIANAIADKSLFDWKWNGEEKKDIQKYTISLLKRLLIGPELSNQEREEFVATPFSQPDRNMLIDILQSLSYDNCNIYLYIPAAIVNKIHDGMSLLQADEFLKDDQTGLVYVVRDMGPLNELDIIDKPLTDDELRYPQPIQLPPEPRQDIDFYKAEPPFLPNLLNTPDMPASLRLFHRQGTRTGEPKFALFITVWNKEPVRASWEVAQLALYEAAINVEIQEALTAFNYLEMQMGITLETQGSNTGATIRLYGLYDEPAIHELITVVFSVLLKNNALRLLDDRIDKLESMLKLREMYIVILALQESEHLFIRNGITTEAIKKELKELALNKGIIGDLINSIFSKSNVRMDVLGMGAIEEADLEKLARDILVKQFTGRWEDKLFPVVTAPQIMGARSLNVASPSLLKNNPLALSVVRYVLHNAIPGAVLSWNQLAMSHILELIWPEFCKQELFLNPTQKPEFALGRVNYIDRDKYVHFLCYVGDQNRPAAELTPMIDRLFQQALPTKFFKKYKNDPISFEDLKTSAAEKVSQKFLEVVPIEKEAENYFTAIRVEQPFPSALDIRQKAEEKKVQKETEQKIKQEQQQSEVIHKNALLIMDVQDCFLDHCTESGAEGEAVVIGSHGIIGPINALRKWQSDYKGDGDNFFSLTAFSKDAHPDGHISFTSSHVDPLTDSHTDNLSDYDAIILICNVTASDIDGRTEDLTDDIGPKCCTQKNMAECGCDEADVNLLNCRQVSQTLYPDHCTIGNNDLNRHLNTTGIDDDPEVIVIEKGGNKFVDDVSMIYENIGMTNHDIDLLKEREGDELGRDTLLPTVRELRSRNITQVYIAGIGTGSSISETAKHLNRLGFSVIILSDAVIGKFDKSTDPDQTQLDILEKLQNDFGILLRSTAEVVAGASRSIKELEPARVRCVDLIVDPVQIGPSFLQLDESIQHGKSADDQAQWTPGFTYHQILQKAIMDVTFEEIDDLMKHMGKQVQDSKSDSTGGISMHRFVYEMNPSGAVTVTRANQFTKSQLDAEVKRNNIEFEEQMKGILNFIHPEFQDPKTGPIVHDINPLPPIIDDSSEKKETEEQIPQESGKPTRINLPLTDEMNNLCTDICNDNEWTTTELPFFPSCHHACKCDVVDKKGSVRVLEDNLVWDPFHNKEVDISDYKCPHSSRNLNPNFNMDERWDEADDIILDPYTIQFGNMEEGPEYMFIQDPRSIHSHVTIGTGKGSFDDPPHLPGTAHLFGNTIIQKSNNKMIGGRFSMKLSDSELFLEGSSLDSLEHIRLQTLLNDLEFNINDNEPINTYIENINKKYEDQRQSYQFRIIQIFRHAMNPKGLVSHFGTGNRHSLLTVPERDGINMIDKLQQWSQSLCPTNMRLVVTAPYPVETIWRVVASSKLATKIKSQNCTRDDNERFLTRKRLYLKEFQEAHHGFLIRSEGDFITYQIVLPELYRGRFHAGTDPTGFLKYYFKEIVTPEFGELLQKQNVGSHLEPIIEQDALMTQIILIIHNPDINRWKFITALLFTYLNKSFRPSETVESENKLPQDILNQLVIYKETQLVLWKSILESKERINTYSDQFLYSVSEDEDNRGVSVLSVPGAKIAHDTLAVLLQKINYENVNIMIPGEGTQEQVPEYGFTYNMGPILPWEDIPHDFELPSFPSRPNSVPIFSQKHIAAQTPHPVELGHPTDDDGHVLFAVRIYLQQGTHGRSPYFKLRHNIFFEILQPLPLQLASVDFMLAFVTKRMEHRQTASLNSFPLEWSIRRGQNAEKPYIIVECSGSEPGQVVPDYTHLLSFLTQATLSKEFADKEELSGIDKWMMDEINYDILNDFDYQIDFTSTFGKNQINTETLQRYIPEIEIDAIRQLISTAETFLLSSNVRIDTLVLGNAVDIGLDQVQFLALNSFKGRIADNPFLIHNYPRFPKENKSIMIRHPSNVPQTRVASIISYVFSTPGIGLSWSQYAMSYVYNHMLKQLASMMISGGVTMSQKRTMIDVFGYSEITGNGYDLRLTFGIIEDDGVLIDVKQDVDTILTQRLKERLSLEDKNGLTPQEFKDIIQDVKLALRVNNPPQVFSEEFEYFWKSLDVSTDNRDICWNFREFIGAELDKLTREDLKSFLESIEVEGDESSWRRYELNYDVPKEIENMEPKDQEEEEPVEAEKVVDEVPVIDSDIPVPTLDDTEFPEFPENVIRKNVTQKSLLPGRESTVLLQMLETMKDEEEVVMSDEFEKLKFNETMIFQINPTQFINTCPVTQIEDELGIGEEEALIIGQESKHAGDAGTEKKIGHPIGDETRALNVPSPYQDDVEGEVKKQAPVKTVADMYYVPKNKRRITDDYIMREDNNDIYQIMNQQYPHETEDWMNMDKKKMYGPPIPMTDTQEDTSTPPQEDEKKVGPSIPMTDTQEDTSTPPQEDEKKVGPIPMTDTQEDTSTPPQEDEKKVGPSNPMTDTQEDTSTPPQEDEKKVGPSNPMTDTQEDTSTPHGPPLPPKDTQKKDSLPHDDRQIEMVPDIPSRNQNEDQDQVLLPTFDWDGFHEFRDEPELDDSMYAEGENDHNNDDYPDQENYGQYPPREQHFAEEAGMYPRDNDHNNDQENYDRHPQERHPPREQYRTKELRRYPRQRRRREPARGRPRPRRGRHPRRGMRPRNHPRNHPHTGDYYSMIQVNDHNTLDE